MDFWKYQAHEIKETRDGRPPQTKISLKVKKLNMAINSKLSKKKYGRQCLG